MQIIGSGLGTRDDPLPPHPGERSHTIEKRENTRTKDLEQHQEFVNMDESKSPSNHHHHHHPLVLQPHTTWPLLGNGLCAKVTQCFIESLPH